MPSNFRQHSVVSSYICTPPQSPAGFTFAIFKRSDKVSTYRGKWAVCSGSIDSTDLSSAAAAKREILEETQLSDPDISLLRRGKPFSLIDEGLNTEWTIHPFVWQLKKGSKPIKLDWEHTEYKFIKPEDLKNYDHVPQLEVGLERVMVSPETEKGLATLRGDHESGAQELAVKALRILLEAVRGNEFLNLSTAEEFWSRLRWIAWHLAKNGRPSMSAAIETITFTALDEVQKDFFATDFKNISVVPHSNLKSYVEITLEAKIAAGKQSLEPIAEGFVHFVERDFKVDTKGDVPSIHIMTLSASGTVTQSLARLVKTFAKKGVDIKLSVLESRPNFEGVAFVNGLFEIFENHREMLARLKIEIVSDASVATVVKDVDCVVIGGDKVIPNGDVSNKIGSAVTAILAKTLNPACKVVALFETSKITSTAFDSKYLAMEYEDEVEVTRSWPSAYVKNLNEKQQEGYQVVVKNTYFEWVPTKYIDHYISEQGFLKREDIARLGAESEELEKRIFGNL